ncbi:MAG TPA: PAS domain S-box protein, partial [Polyangiales bacterium]|nr:PAS domain S-box protein [Polyangiales bacterium]
MASEEQDTLQQEVESLRRECERLQVLARGGHEGLLAAILEHSPHGVIVSDAEGKFLLQNVAAERIWAGSASTRGIDDWKRYKGFHPDGRPYEAEDWAMSRCLRTREIVYAHEVRIQRFDGTRGVILGSCAPILGPRGEVRGALSVFADITKSKELEASTEAAHRRSSFLSEVGTALLSSRLDSREGLERAAELAVPAIA